MYIIPVILVFIVSLIMVMKYKVDLIIIPITLIISIVITTIVVGIDYSISISDKEVWSGKITDVVHTEEWKEWHQPRIESYEESYTEKGKIKTRIKTRVIPGYWEYHNATNKITTSDNGTFNITVTPDGEKMNNDFVNSTDELEKYYPLGSPSASVHSYKNKVQASYSIYRKDIDLDDYPDLPNYPEDVVNYVSIDRIIGDVPEKEKALKTLANNNSELNKTIDDPDNPGKTKSYKQVNIIFVNLGDVPVEYGYALENRWEGGNKNDFIITFGMDDQNNVTWAYPFSWSEIEILKINVRDYMLEQKNMNDFSVIVDDVSKMVEKDFVRKEFGDFEYLSIEVGTGACIIIWIFNILISVIVISMSLQKYESKRL